MKSSSLLELLITIIIITVGVIVIARAFIVSLSATGDIRNVAVALNIASAKMEEIKNTPFTNLVDSGPAPDPNFPDFDLTVDVAEGQNPMRVEARVAWDVKGGEANIVLTTQVADY